MWRIFTLVRMGAAGCSDRDPIYIVHFKRGCAQSIVVANDHAGDCSACVDGEYVARFACGKTEAFALADGEIVDSVVMPDDCTIFGDNFAFGFGQRDPRVLGIGLDELNVIASGNETKFHAFGLFGDRKISSACDGTYFVFC